MPSEKERVYQELDETRARCAKLKAQIRLLERDTTKQETAVVRAEMKAYRSALANIQYRLENDDLTSDELQSIVTTALTLRGLSIKRRSEDLREGEEIVVYRKALSLLAYNSQSRSAAQMRDIAKGALRKGDPKASK